MQILLFVILLSFRLCCGSYEELFGNGNFRPEDKVRILPVLRIFSPIFKFDFFLQKENAVAKFLSSSTEDLILLFKAEKSLVQKFGSNEFLQDDKTNLTISEFLNSIDYE